MRLIILLVFALGYLALGIFLRKKWKLKVKAYEEQKGEVEKGQGELEKLEAENAVTHKELEEAVALYDITKDLRKELDEERIFKLFKERISAFVRLEECRYLRTPPEGGPSQQTVVPLALEEEIVGYLVARGVAEEDQERFQILARQFESAIKGSYLFRKIQEMTVVDSLTQVFNRRYFLERFTEELERSRKFSLSLSFLMVDMDRFKEINDTFGHLVGDAMIQQVTQGIKQGIRQIDFLGRYGGEEVSIVLTETGREGAKLVGERIRQAIEKTSFRAYDETLKVTVSVGIATFPDDAKEGEELIDRADAALYRAKELGRNRVCACTSLDK